MDLMEILKALFGDEALTFEQFAEKVNNKVIFPCQTLALVRVTVLRGGTAGTIGIRTLRAVPVCMTKKS